jgi:ubiquinone/menaquinone biosynthesis C-methylase UbiE
MSTIGDTNSVTFEQQRVLAEYERRTREIKTDLYAPWRPDAAFMALGTRYKAAAMLHKAGVFPKAGTQCLEIGYGSIGWLGELINWGISETDLHGIEVDAVRARRAQESLPNADLRVGNAIRLTWTEGSFDLVIVSTVFTSILDTQVRRMVAGEIERVLKVGGTLLWYDFAVNNPNNAHVRKVDRKELKELFPHLSGEVKSITLAPPLARFIAPRSWVLATMLEAIPFLRTHLIGVLIKNS